MTIVLPEFKRCCCCLPLRTGLLAWGYFKMIVDVVIIVLLAYLTAIFFMASLYFQDFYSITVAVVSLITLMTVAANFVATFAFVIGCHEKKVKKIRRFYVYSICELIVMAVLMMMAVGITIRYWRAETRRGHLVIYTIYLLTLALHAYFILLLRSEVIKLETSFEISIVINSADAEYCKGSKEKEETIEFV
ncbi:hypothetical protein PYW07_012077 [Mythimna separata]|uniref:Uncharacterized protein n=1 Tax=Mythimna separata TaxID=271217 RepID=A0AAD7YMA2_MYTSE|nr:hypothetical protein PYW07_012077 [Mythimna separata]